MSRPLTAQELRQMNEAKDEARYNEVWREAVPMKPPRHWPWLQRIVDWLWRR